MFLSPGSRAKPRSNKTQGRKLLNTLTASASASLDDTTSITATFTEYEIVLENIIAATASQTLEIQVQSAAAFQTATYVCGIIVGNGSTVVGQTLTTGLPLVNVGGANTTAPGMSAVLRLSAPAGTTISKNIFGTWVANASVGGTTGGFWNGGTGAVTGFRLIMTSGNITSGVMKVYGLV